MSFLGVVQIKWIYLMFACGVIRTKCALFVFLGAKRKRSLVVGLKDVDVCSYRSPVCVCDVCVCVFFNVHNE